MNLAMLERLSKAFGRRPVEGSLTWHPPALLDQGAIGAARLAMDRHGKGLALWENGGQLWSMEQGVGSPRALVRLPVASGHGPRVVMDPQGRGSALWTAADADGAVLMGRPLNRSQALAHELFTTRGRIHHLQAAVDRRGSVMAVWCHQRDDRFEVLAQRFDTRSGEWERRPAQLGPRFTTARGLGLAMNLRGHAMVVMPADDDRFRGLVCCHYWPTDRIWSDHPVPVCPGRVSDHRVAMDAGGNAQALLIVDDADGRQSLFACGYDARSSEWGEPSLLAAGQGLGQLRLAMAPDGSAFAAWSQSESAGNPRLLGRWFQGGAWERTPMSLASGRGAATDFAVDVVGEGRGTLLVCQSAADGHQVCVRGLEDGAGAPVPLGPACSQPAVRPRLVHRPEGAVALWVQPNGDAATLHLAHGR